MEEITPEVEIRSLRALEAIVETGTFRAAARELGYTQSAISHQVTTLESAVGRPLLTRPGGRGKVQLTAAGQAVLRRGRRALSQLDAIAADIEELDRDGPVVLRIGVSQTTAAEIMPAALRLFHEDHPGVEVVLTEMSDDETAISSLVRGRLDLTFTHRARPDERIESELIADDPWVILVREDDPATRLSDPGFELLDGVDVVAWTRRWRAQVELEEVWSELGIAPRIVYRSDDNLALQRLVAAGLGRACVGHLAARRAIDPSLTWLAPRQVLPEHQIFLCTSRLQPPSASTAALAAAVRANVPAG
ncbi:MAG: LysR family transcriptional regulator [Acidimicrobiales bacterium]